MEKLLHQRLAEINDIANNDFVFEDGYEIWMPEDEAKHLIEEIDRTYILRPRDNKGIPFMTGDIVYSIDPDTEYAAEVISVNAHTLYVLWDDNKYDVVDACEMQHEKPKKPDSLEKLRDDVVRTLNLLDFHSFLIDGIEDRFNALIEKEEQ